MKHPHDPMWMEMSTEPLDSKDGLGQNRLSNMGQFNKLPPLPLLDSNEKNRKRVN